MNQDTLKNLCERGLSSYEIAEELNSSPSSIRRELKRLGFETKPNRFYSNKTRKVCPKCEQEKILENFYPKNGINGAGSYCKDCTVKQSLDRQKRFKQDCVTYKGGKCGVCSFDKFLSALEFHHLDPSKKDFNLSRAKLTNFEKNPLVKKELDKCVLVCSNCHRGIHSGEVLLDNALMVKMDITRIS